MRASREKDEKNGGVAGEEVRQKGGNQRYRWNGEMERGGGCAPLGNVTYLCTPHLTPFRVIVQEARNLASSLCVTYARARGGERW